MFSFAFETDEYAAMNRRERRLRDKKSKGADKAAHYGTLGVELANQGDLKKAISAFRNAILLKPDYTNAHYSLGSLLSRQGLPDEAIISFKKALDLQPDHFDSLYNMGNALQMLGRYDEAETAYQSAISLNPGHAATHANLGNTLKDQGKFSEAILAFKQGIAADPGFTNAYYNLGVLHLEQGRQKQAIEIFQQALTLSPEASGHPALLCNLGLAYRESGQIDDAIACYRKALACDPGFAEAHNNLGNTLQGMGQFDDAVASFSAAILNAPEDINAYINLGNVLLEQGRLEAVEVACRRALELDSSHADAHFDLAIALLRMGCLIEGWQEYEWRWQSTLFRAAPRVFPHPPWDGSDLNEKSILLWAEQGIGDEIRYASMIPDVLKTGAKVTIECNERVVDIFARSFKGCDVHPAPYRDAESGQDIFDFQCSLASLGQFFRNDFESFTTNAGAYLHADQHLLNLWKARLGKIDDRPKIGVSWSSSVSSLDRDHYNASISELAPILAMPDVTFVNLQSHDSQADIDEAKKLYGIDIHAWADLDLRNDLDQVAALTSSLDLVVSFPTFAAEISAALGVPTLVFHSEKTHFDFLGTGKSIWQPDIRYFIKNNRDEPWRRVFLEIVQAVREMLDNKNY